MSVTRAEIITALRSSDGPMTATQLSEALRRNRGGALHRHLDSLEADGIIRTTRLRTGRRGKPPRLVELVDERQVPSNCPTCGQELPE